MSKKKSGGNLLNQPLTIETSVETESDPLPWLIHNLLEKQADHSQTNQGKQVTEQPNESS